MTPGEVTRNVTDDAVCGVIRDAAHWGAYSGAYYEETYTASYWAAYGMMFVAVRAQIYATSCHSICTLARGSLP